MDAEDVPPPTLLDAVAVLFTGDAHVAVVVGLTM
jgi:hypothetical protein